MKAYLHSNFTFLQRFLPCDCHLFQDLSDLPRDVDLVAYSGFVNEECERELEILCDRSAKVLFDWNEFVENVQTEHLDLNVAAEQAWHDKFPNLQIFGTVVPNYASRIKFSGYWWMTSDLYYADSELRPWAAKLLHTTSRREDKTQMFDCLLGNRRTHRDFIAKQYVALPRRVRKQFVFSYYRNDISQGIWNFDTSHISKSSECIDIDGDHISASAVMPIDIYNRTWFSIVAETAFSNKISFFTEKVLKPIIRGRVFVCFAGQHYLRNLRSLGFRTFGHVIDESYDEIENHEERWTAAWQQVIRLLDCDPVAVYAAVKNELLHNKSVYNQTDWLANVKQTAMHWSGSH